MGISLEQARVLDAVAQQGSFAKAAKHLGKRHSGLIELVKKLEDETRLTLLDRSQYRATLTPVGRRVWEECRRILDATNRFDSLCENFSVGWEPRLRIVMEGLVPFDSVLKTLNLLTKDKVPTKIQVFTAFHRGVEEVFVERQADIMISVLAPVRAALEPVALTPIRSHLVAHKNHPLVADKRVYTIEDFRAHRFVTVQGSNPRLNLSTSPLDEESDFHVHDFSSKKLAIMSGLGFGWMPQYLIEDELKSGVLKIIRWEKTSAHTYFPRLYHRGEHRLGKAAKLFLHEFLSRQNVPKCERCAFDV